MSAASSVPSEVRSVAESSATGNPAPLPAAASVAASGAPTAASAPVMEDAPPVVEGLEEAVEPTKPTGKNFVFHTIESLRPALAKNEEKNYGFTEPIVLVSNLHSKDPKKEGEVIRSALTAELMKPFLKDEIIAFNGYAAMNILISILDAEPIDSDIAELVTFTKSLAEKGMDIPSLQYLFFMFLAQMNFFANIQQGKEVINIQKASFTEQYEMVRKECAAGVAKMPPAFFGVEQQKFETGQKSTASNNPGEEQSWWERASKGAFVCVKEEVTMTNFIEIFKMGPLAMLKCLELEKAVLTSDDDEAKSLISELRKYREADLFAPEKPDDDISSTILTMKGRKAPQFETAEQLIEYLKVELSKVTRAAAAQMDGIGDAGGSDDDSDDDDAGDAEDMKKPTFAPSVFPRPVNTKHAGETKIKGPSLPSLFPDKPTTVTPKPSLPGDKPKALSLFGSRKSPTSPVATAATPVATAPTETEARAETEPIVNSTTRTGINLPEPTPERTGPSSITGRPAGEVLSASAEGIATPCKNDMCGEAVVGGGKRNRTRKNRVVNTGGGAPVISIKL